MNNIKIPDTLVELSSYFKKDLYAVGGFVRDSLLGVKNHDIDICGPATPEEVIKYLKNTDYSVTIESEKMFTLLISYKKETYEYTSFRVDSYIKGHRPTSVISTDNIIVDATRRDFTINAIYYDVKNNVIVDPLNGTFDLEQKLIRTTRDADLVFSEDGLRLMRLARFASSLGFSIDPKTEECAKNNCILIKDIANERIKDELNLLLVSDLKYGIKDAVINGFDILRNIGVLDIILPELTLGYGMKQRSDFHEYDVYYHILHTVQEASPDIRLAALMHDIAKPYCKINYGVYKGHDYYGSIISKNILSRLLYSNKIINTVSILTLTHMFNIKNDATINEIKLFVVEYDNYLESIYKLKYADWKGSGKSSGNYLESAEILIETRKKLKGNHVPFSISELLVNGNDFITTFVKIPQQERGNILKSLLKECIIDYNNYNTRKKQLKYLENENNKY